ncbi:Up-regulated during septation-domain-containing protein [Lineolata rhizophorae]|uniref:Up-regulated during septation-domain-containing protein n=1 Tax=Lineolata rhizophorae TaxID=578093 RepID=A0A6A6P9Q2_9PEZI|nr:Up-regulated during septation-domain-containing protein [Lineolata rhizophorae]
MTHIANCMRTDAENLCFAEETVQPPRNNALMEAAKMVESQALPRRQLKHSKSQKFQLQPPEGNPQSSSSQVSPNTDKSIALSAGRSPTSLSDTAVGRDGLGIFRSRAGSISRRRKVSVPELGSTMTTVQEQSVDSPTIPGRPPLRSAVTEPYGHERSNSAPGSGWRYGPFGDAMVSCVTGPAPFEQNSTALSSGAILRTQLADQHKPLSPIISPTKPVLKIDTAAESSNERSEAKPEVPPKSPCPEQRGSPSTKASALSARTPVLTPSTNPSSVSSPGSAMDRQGSPNAWAKRENPPAHTRNTSENSVLDRGRPFKRSEKRQRNRAFSEAQSPDIDRSALWQLPRGQRATEASASMRTMEKESLRNQAMGQAEKFEVLGSKDVAALSKELRALDERCEYLRKTYKSLRSGRQRLHTRMISYLKRSETLIFSRESLLKQEEALAELDLSIDDWILKLEQAENRRLRVRQKLLEHVAAAITLSPSASEQDQMVVSTPPRSPVKAESPNRGERRDVESIRIYADGHVLSLFSDIEKAIGQMCEAC